MVECKFIRHKDSEGYSGKRLLKGGNYGKKLGGVTKREVGTRETIVAVPSDHLKFGDRTVLGHRTRS